MGNKKEHNAVEITSFILGLIIILALVGFLIYQMTMKKEGPPGLQVTTAFEPEMQNYGFRIEVENTGEKTAEAAAITLSLYQQGKAVDDGTVTFQYIPVKSKETAWIVFHKEPQAGDSLVVSSVTFVEP